MFLPPINDGLFSGSEGIIKSDLWRSWFTKMGSFPLGEYKTITNATDAGRPGDVCWDASYIYVCVAANTWRRAAISVW